MSAWKIEVSQHAGRYSVALVVGPQRFTLDYQGTSHDGSEWVSAQLRHAIEAIERGAMEEAAKYVDGEGEKIAKRSGDMPVLAYSLADGIRKLRGGKP